jgi:hypothetical protein
MACTSSLRTQSFSLAVELASSIATPLIRQLQPVTVLLLLSVLVHS